MNATTTTASLAAFFGLFSLSVLYLNIMTFLNKLETLKGHSRPCVKWRLIWESH